MATTPTPNPATSPLSVDEFASRIKTKYPEYAGLDNATLASKVVAKYPEYKGKVALSSSSGAANMAPPPLPGLPIPAGLQQPDKYHAQDVPIDIKQSETPALLGGTSGTISDPGIQQDMAALGDTKPHNKRSFGLQVADNLSGAEIPENQHDIQLRAQNMTGLERAEQTPLLGPHIGTGAKAVKSFGKGRISEGLGYTGATALPVFGPVAAGAGEKIGTGDVKGGLADVTSLAVPDIIARAMPPRTVSSGDLAGEPVLRPKLSNQIVGPVVKKPVGQVLEDVKFGKNPAKAITDEGLVGTEDSLLKQADARTKQLSAAIDNKLQTHPNSSAQIDAGPIIDEAINNAVSAARKTGNSGIETRLEALRTALKSEYGPIKGTPYEINQLKRQVGEVGSELGAFKTADPVEASAASAMADVYGGLKRAVNAQVPDAAPLNERVGNLISAKAALKRNIALGTNKSAISGMSLTNFPFKIAEKTLLSPLARTVAARVVNAGNKLGIPDIVQGAMGPLPGPNVMPGAPGAGPEPVRGGPVSNPQLTGDIPLPGGGVLRKPPLLLGNGNVQTPPSAAGTFEHVPYNSQANASTLPGGIRVPRQIGAGPDIRGLLPPQVESAIGLPERSQSTITNGRSIESPASNEGVIPALIRDYVNGNAPTEHPDITAMKNATAHNSPAQAAEFNERGAQQLFGRPYGTLSVPERLQAIRKGTELQTEAMRTGSASGHSNIGGGSLEELGRGQTIKVSPRTGTTSLHGGSIDIGNGEAVLRQRPDGSLEVANNNSGLRDSEILARFGRNAAETYGKPGRAPNTIELIHSSGEHGDVPLNRVSDYLASGHYRLAPRR